MKNKKLWISYAIFNSVMICLILIVGLILYFVLHQEQFLVTGFISVPFSLIIYFLMIYLMSIDTSDTSKFKKMFLIVTIVRFFLLVLSFTLSFIYIYFTDNREMPYILYSLVCPTLNVITLLFSTFINRKELNNA